MARGTSISELATLLAAKGGRQSELHRKARSVRRKFVSNKVYFRGLIEFSNICANNCLYCGIRESNSSVKRYSMTKEEIVNAVSWCHSAGYGSVVLQSGELRTKAFAEFVVDTVTAIKESMPDIGVTLCVGEQKKRTYERFFDAGASRYLLRIETSNEEHYRKLHPSGMSFRYRRKCLLNLKEIGFQVGTGVMIGSNFQTIENLVNDLLFFEEIDVDMVGMGPYIPNRQSPLGVPYFSKAERLNLSLNMIAALRLMMPDINIASTTALQALHPRGRELGLLAGANVIMPNATPKGYRRLYALYDGRPCVDESSQECLHCIVQRIRSTGMTPAFGKRGDSKHFLKRGGR